MKKITLTIDLTKLDKTRIQERTYQNKEGETVTVKEYKMDVIELKEPKTIKEYDNSTLKKTHFVVDSQNKEEREAKKESNFIGEGMQFIEKVSEKETVDYPQEENADDIPF